MTTRLISLRAYAASRKERGLPGGTLAAVQKAVKSGRVTLIDGKVDPDAADAEWLANTSVEQQARGKRGGMKHPKGGSAPSGDSADGSKDRDRTTEPPDGEPEDYLSARARKETALADLAEMEAAELRGELVRLDDVTKCWGEMASAIRARLLVLPSVAAPQVAPHGRAAEAQGILRKLVNEALQELSGDGLPERASKRARRNAADT